MADFDWTYVLTLLLLMVVSVIMVVFVYKTTIAPTNPNQVRDLTEVEQWQLIADRFARTHDYISCDNNVTYCYNCVNYSTDLQHVGKELGFDVHIKIGCRYDNSSKCHAWTGTTFDNDPQLGGDFVDYKNVYNLTSEVD